MKIIQLNTYKNIFFSVKRRKKLFKEKNVKIHGFNVEKGLL